MFYGPVGGAHCLLKWCFTGPTVTISHTHTHACAHYTVESVGDGRISGDEGEEKQDINAPLCSRMLQVTGMKQHSTFEHDRLFSRDHWAESGPLIPF